MKEHTKKCTSQGHIFEEKNSKKLLVSEKQINNEKSLVKQSSTNQMPDETSTTERASKKEILNENKMTENILKVQIPGEENTNKYVDEHGILNETDKRFFEKVDYGIDSTTVVDQSREKIEKSIPNEQVFETSSIDENCNLSVPRNSNKLIRTMTFDSNKETTEYISENRIIDAKNLTKYVSKNENHFEKNKIDNVAKKKINDEKRSIEHTSTNQSLTFPNVKDTTEWNSNDRILDKRETTEYISIVSKTIVDESVARIEKFVESNRGFEISGIDENFNLLVPSNMDNATHNISMDDDKHAPEYVSEDKNDDDKIKTDYSAKNLVSADNRSIEPTSANKISNTKETTGQDSKDRINNETEMTERISIVSETIVDQSAARIKKFVESNRVLEISSIDEKFNLLVPSNSNQKMHDMTVDFIGDEEEIPKSLMNVLDENDTTEYITENLIFENHDDFILNSSFDLKLLSNANIEESLRDEFLDVSARNSDLNPNSTYTLDVSGFEPSKDVYNVLDKLSEINKPRETLYRSRYYIDQKYSATTWKPERFFELQNALTVLPPTCSSTLLDISTPSTDLVRASDDEDSASLDELDDEEYIPDVVESSASDAGSDTDKMLEKSISRNVRQNMNKSSLNISLGLNKPGMSAPDDTELAVSTSKAAAHSKNQFCFYCKTFKSKLGRHLEDVHKEEEDVKKFSSLPAKNLERMQMIARIRKKGNHLHNTDRRFNKGELIVVRRPQEKMKKTAQDFVACGNCKGQYSRTVIRHHFKKCTNKSGINERLVMVKGRKVSARVHENASELVRSHIFPYLREDSVVRGIRYDKLVVKYANKQCEKYGTHQHHYQMIRARIRLLGRFLAAIKSLNDKIKNFSDVFVPRHYDEAVQAVKNVAGFNERTRTFDRPAVASNLGTLLKNIGQILRSEYIKEERAHDQKRVEDFLKLQIEDYGTSVNRAVLETQQQNNRLKKVVLPNLEDITKLHNFLKFKHEKYFERLNNLFSDHSWRKLAEITIISLQVFNRRRAGEIERIYLEDFDSYQGIDTVENKDVYSALSKEGQALAKKYVRFMIRGKLGRGVPFLVPSNLLDSLLLVKKYRAKANVPEINPYLFGLPSKDIDRFKHLQACVLMRQFSQECGAQLPETLRGTQLRKHVATNSIALNLSDHQVSELANFLGHDDKIHKNIYRQPILETDIIKISQLLEMAQGTHGSSSDDEDTSSEEEEDEENVRSTVQAEMATFSRTRDTENSNDSRGLFTTILPRTSNSNPSVPATLTGSSHRRWTDKERETVLGAFQETMQAGKMPTGEQINNLIEENDCLKGREVAQLRAWLHNKKKKYVEISFQSSEVSIQFEISFQSFPTVKTASTPRAEK